METTGQVQEIACMTLEELMTSKCPRAAPILDMHSILQLTWFVQAVLSTTVTLW
jgi:hypothetical protein